MTTTKFARGVVLLALLALTGCGLPRPPKPPQPPQPETQAIAVQVFEFTNPGVTVPGASIQCWSQNPPATDRGTTNGDGYLQTEGLIGEHFECTAAKEGYEATTAAFRPQPQGPGCEECGTLRMTLTANAPPPPPPPAETPNPLIGPLRIVDGTRFADSSGPVLPTYAHAGDLFSVYVRDPGRATEQLDRLAGAGYHGVRSWMTLGCGPNTAQGCRPGDYWRGREVGPDVTPDYWGKVRAWLGELQTRRLRLVASQGDIGQIRDRAAYMRALRALHDEQPVIDWIDCGNEAWQTGEPDPNRLAECVGYYGGGASLRTLTDAPIYNGNGTAVEVFNRYSIPPADAFDVHSFRGGHVWDKRRHIWGYTYCGEGCPEKKVGIGSEPPGNGARVSVTDNKQELDDEGVALLALASQLGRQAFVWFSGEGVILDAGLQGEAGFWSVPRAVALLPREVMSYRVSHHSGGTWSAQRILEPVGQVRIDGRASDGGAFAYTIDGPPGRYALPVTRAFEGKLCHPGTGACEDVALSAGQTLNVEFVRGRLLFGRRR